MSQVIKAVNVMSVAKVGGLVYALMGLAGGLLFSFFAVLGGAAGAPDNEYGGLIGMAIGVGAVIFLPLFYGFMGFLFGGLTALAYNFIAGFVGGVEITLENIPEPVYPAYSASRQTPV